MSRLMPRQPVPALEVAALDHGTWRLADQRPKAFTIVVFYRGLTGRCAACSGHA